MITTDGLAPDWFHRVLLKINAAFSAIRPDNAVKVTGGTINGTTIGLTTPAAAAFTTTSVAGLTSTQLMTTLGGATFLATSSALTNGAGVGAGTLLTAPAAGNPTKWIGINDNGTVRYIPAW